MKKRILIGIFILLIPVLISCYVYFGIISPQFIKKPYIEKPDIIGLDENSDNLVIEDSMVNYIANEIGSYNLHEDPTSGEIPEMEFIVNDFEEVFTVRIIDNIPRTEKGSAANPDLRIIASQPVILDILDSEDIQGRIVKHIEEGDVEIEVLANEATLGMKGYKAVYDSINKNTDLITGKVTMELNPMGFVSLIKLCFLICLFLIIELAFLYETH
ncbi:hypothetical protein JXB41_04395 [Candidatus Woesearchaeota archaeon]|nr:hypothetical protein [Candidatus Woesearchaeota archaeon]